MMRRYALIALLTLIVLIVFVLVLPGQAACALGPLLGFKSQASGFYADSHLNATQLTQLSMAARERINQTFGQTRSRPALIFFDETKGIGVFKLSPYAATHFLGAYACITVGTKGQNIDVIAHEFMHAELHERVGFWQYFFEIPTWFDEGLAMQVDQRDHYELKSPIKQEDVLAIQQLTSSKKFFTQDELKLTAHYALAKLAVQQSLLKIGHRSLYEQLDKIKHGQSFMSIVH
jgi:hypothetical protein